MPLRFYRRFRAGPFVINPSKLAVSYSAGGRGVSFTVGRHVRTISSSHANRPERQMMIRHSARR